MDAAALERLILKKLSEQPGNLMMPEPHLLNECRVQCGQAIATDIFAARLDALKQRAQVIGIPSDDYTRWKIAANGLARLAELGAH
jgi:hypothetical protein